MPCPVRSEDSETDPIAQPAAALSPSRTNGDAPAAAATARSLFALWNRSVEHLPPVSELTEERERKATIRVRKRPDLAWWERAIREADESAFCRGEGERGWVATFDWLIANGTNAVKVLEGKYRTNGNGRRWTSPKTAGNVAAAKEAAARIAGRSQP